MDHLSASLQDCLESVLFMERDRGEARVADLAGALDVKMPSVVKSLLKLKDLGLIEQEPYQAVRLTARGKIMAKKISRRHTVLKEFFMTVLCLDEATAEQDACRIEHVISSRAFEELARFVRESALGSGSGKGDRHAAAD